MPLSNWLKKYSLLIFVVPLLFLVIGISTLDNYGISWDESFHFQRGQAYLRYFLTGEKDFLKLPAYPKLRGDSDFMGRTGEQDIYINAQKSVENPNSNIRRSYYQSDVFTFSFLTAGFDGGHPPVSDILAALSNYIFYQKLGIVGDIEAYHLFEIFASFLLVLAVSILVYRNFGKLPAIVAALSISLYPLFWAESHFNIKDPPETAFLGLTIISFYFGVVSKNWKLIVLAAAFAGLSIGTKFNAIFLPFVLFPWLLARLKIKGLNFNKEMIKSLIVFPFLVFGIFFVSWPYLWQDTQSRLFEVFNYYKGIGIGLQQDMTNYIFSGINTYPAQWIFFTTPLPILFISLLGVFYAVYCLVKKKEDIFILILLWLFVPIIRVSVGGTNIYGGVRQIMEFIPALSIMCGIGAYSLLNLKLSVKFRQVRQVFLILIFASFAFVWQELAIIHPNENVYFNQLIGGLSGAVDKEIPSWGNTYGNVYYQGVKWLNNNAEKDAKLALSINNMVNVPRIKLRPDIYFSNAFPSGSQKQGEYIMELSHDWEPKKWYGFSYYDKFLNPVHEVKVDGVALLKVWKNDTDYARPEFLQEKVYEDLKYVIRDSVIIVDLEKEALITRIEITYEGLNCNSKLAGGYIRLSINGRRWVQEPESINYPQLPEQWLGTQRNKFVFLFSGKPARFIYLDTENKNSCMLKNPKIRVSALTQ